MYSDGDDGIRWYLAVSFPGERCRCSVWTGQNNKTQSVHVYDMASKRSRDVRRRLALQPPCFTVGLSDWSECQVAAVLLGFARAAQLLFLQSAKATVANHLRNRNPARGLTLRLARLLVPS
jgi:hypothetical protein